MKEVVVNNRFGIWDDVLTPDEFGKLMVHFSKEKFHKQHSRTWENVWKLSDGDCLQSGSLYVQGDQVRTRHFDSAIEPLYQAMLANLTENPELCGLYPNDWGQVILTSYIYGAGSRLSWHGDGDEYTAALTYYCHPRWSPHWGGELLIANTPPSSYMPAIDYDVDPAIDHSRFDAWINAYGVGHMVVPKPNRLVLMKAGVCHMVNRVDPAAGDNLRMSVVGFTSSLKPKGQNAYGVIQGSQESVHVAA